MKKISSFAYFRFIELKKIILLVFGSVSYFMPIFVPNDHKQ